MFFIQSNALQDFGGVVAAFGDGIGDIKNIEDIGFPVVKHMEAKPAFRDFKGKIIIQSLLQKQRGASLLL